MKRNSFFLRGLCLACAVVMALAFSACGKSKKQAVSQVSKAASDVGRLTSEGYELPYEYPDGYKGVMKVPDGSEYKTVSTTPGGNMVFHLTTDKSVEEVQKFYDDYFATLQRVKPKKVTDTSEGYFDKDKRMIIFNMNVWTADGKTNYKLGAEACDKLEDSKIWEAAQ